MKLLANMRLPAQLTLFWERVTLSRITKFYFIFSVFHCIVQVVLQVQAFTSNAQAASFLWKLVVQGNAFDPGFAVMGPNDLRFCEEIPSSFSTKTCQVVWSANSTQNKNSTTDQTPQSDLAVSSSLSSSSTISFPSLSPVVPSPTSSTLTSSPSSVTHSQQVNVVSTVTITHFATPATTVKSQATSSSPKPITTVVANGNHDDDDDDDDEEEEEEEHEHDKKRSLYARNDLLGLQISAVEINGSTTVNVDGFGWKNQSISLSQRCLFTLNYPVETLNNTKREDITFILFQIWVLGMSIVALLNESVPHIVTSLLTHVGATAWAAFQIVHTADFHRQFSRLTTEGACGVNLLPTYWNERANAEIPGLALNALSLLISAFLSWRLIKSFGWQTFKRVGASRTINRVYMLVLMLSIAIQLSLFFIVASIGIWIDQLFNGAVGHLASLSSVYKGIMITVLLLLVPWLILGWISVRREMRIPMLLFLVMSFLYLCGWGAMFASSSFRWTFKLWRFFSIITSASVLLTLVTFVIGLMCRMNFGKGLSRYLNAQEPLPDYQEEQDYEYDDEKVEFPTNRALPTFSAAFGKGDEVPVPSQMKFGPPRVGPRFTNPSVEPFEPQAPPPSLMSGTTYSKETYANSITSPTNSIVYLNPTQLSRQLSNGSQRSYSSFRSDGSAQTFKTHKSTGSVRSTASGGSTASDRSRRWVIE